MMPQPSSKGTTPKIQLLNLTTKTNSTNEVINVKPHYNKHAGLDEIVSQNFKPLYKDATTDEKSGY